MLGAAAVVRTEEYQGVIQIPSVRKRLDQPTYLLVDAINHRGIDRHTQVPFFAFLDFKLFPFALIGAFLVAGIAGENIRWA